MRAAACAAAAAVAASGCGGAGPPAETRPGTPTAVAGEPAPDTGVPRGGAVLDGRVTRVVDGDTIRVEARTFETVVRLLGIDAPETRRPGTPVQCFGPEATARARALLPEGTAVRVVGDPGQDVRDRFDRLLAYVYVAGSPTSVNERLVRDGAARVYVFRPASPFALVERFRRAEGAARAARRGLWGPPCNSSLASGTAPNG